MLIRSLEAYGVPTVLIDTWESAYGPDLLPVQERAVVAGVLGGASLLVTAPTSSGKTFIGEMAAAHAAMQGRKVVYLVPTKALAESKYQQFIAEYEALGLRVGIATRDRRGQERGIRRGEFDLTVAVPEKMRALLLDCPGLAGSIAAVVADELQVIGDAERGPCLELLLADLLHNGAGPQFIGLSAVLEHADRLASWAGAELVRDDRRPVELRKGVLLAGTYHYREHNSGRIAQESWPELEGGSEEASERLAQVASHLASQEGSVLVFLPDKLSTVRVSRLIAEEAALPAAETLTSELTSLEPTQATDLLTELARQGVAFHNADLQFEARAALERAFARGELPALVCTSTLAMGVNLPARNVLVDVQRWRTSRGGRPTLGAISRADFENIAGRAGRLGYEEQFGRAILLADSELRRQILFHAYIDGDFADLRPQFSEQSPLQQICLLAGSSDTEGEAGVLQAYERTLGSEESTAASGVLPPALEEAARFAAAEGLMAQDKAHGGWVPTALGRLCGTSGLSPSSFLALLRAAHAAADDPPDEAAALLAAALCQEAQAVPLPPPLRGWGEWQTADGAAGFLDELRDPAAPPDDLELRVADLLCRPDVAGSSASAAQHERAARIVLAVHRWQSREATMDIERSLRIPAGRLALLAETVGWIVQVLAHIGRELSWPDARWRRLSRLGESVAAGVPEEGLALHQIRVAGMTRGHIIALLDAGIASPAELADSDEARIRALLGPAMAEKVLDTVRGRVRGPSPSPPMCQAAANSEHAARPDAPRLRLFLDSHRPDRVMLGDTPVQLRPAEFKLLKALAQQPRKCIAYDDIYQQMWGDEQFVESAQIYSHRSRLAKKLQQAIANGAELLVTVPKHGLMLDLAPEEVVLQ